MPRGKVKWFDPAKGFGYVSGEDGTDAYLRASALPEGVTSLRAGTKVEYSFADGRRGPQVLSLTVLETPRPTRRQAEEMVPMVEDLIKLLDGASKSLRRGHYPENSAKVAKVLRVLANDFDF